ncbi:DUF4180 domain-containing protein [Leptospira sp. 201903070]|uniref:DUF4180 domain-containing protein n=1 Tax=Leptospira ainlahdjerensis TaxID=2810033 RepID=A0ABS2UD65_9LEPT|nr:DUF4180 domain-containing protein [Leptospira ainlahdjerensis]MBM9577493.1 DUF4180 domain-containing protein [Leptospira ainlahdjerensis]
MKEIETAKGTILFFNEEDLKIQDVNSFLELVYSAKADTFAFNRSSFPDSFFDLKTGFAGEILQKTSNYKIRILIVGDISKYNSKSFQDFVYESNQNGKIIFCDLLETGIVLLK